MTADSKNLDSTEGEDLEEGEGLGFMLPPKARQPHDVYILGAGFSRALSSAMPLMKELSAAVSGYATSYGGPMTTSGLDSTIGNLIRRNFEEALSYLAEWKPWLDESDNQKDKVRLLELTRNIRFAIGRCQQTAREQIASGQCDWIIPLIEHWHQSRAVVVTLNYDTLVEEIAERVGSREYPGIPVAGQPGSSTSDPRSFLRVCNIHPPILRDKWLGSTDATFSNYYFNQPSFKLLKLHGSVNWLKSPDPNAHSDTISYIPGIEVPVDGAGSLPATIADKVPFIIPPVPNKSSLVHHDSLRAMWRSAAEAIRGAKRVIIVGYSMPISDTMFIQLIRGNLFAANPTVELVNSDRKLLKKVKELLTDESSAVVQRSWSLQSFVAKRRFL